MIPNKLEEKHRKIFEITRKKRLYTIAGIILYALSIVAIFIWYDWKLFVILTAFVGANNLFVETNKL